MSESNELPEWKPKRWMPVSMVMGTDGDQGTFVCEVDVGGLPFNALNWMMDPERLAGELWPIFAKRVRNWNAQAFDVKTGEWIPVPSPIEGGPDVFKELDFVVTWACRDAFFLTLVGATEPQKKESPPSDDGRSTQNADGADSGISLTRNRSQRRKESVVSSGSTSRTR